jgi:hypothetical protein
VERFVPLASRSEDLVEDAVIGYFDELAYSREMLDRRYDDLESGKAQPIDGEAFFEGLRQREEELMKKPMPRRAICSVSTHWL